MTILAKGMRSHQARQDLLFGRWQTSTRKTVEVKVRMYSKT